MSFFPTTAATQQSHRSTVWFLGDVALLAARKSIRTMFHLRALFSHCPANIRTQRRISCRYTPRIIRVRRSESLCATRSDTGGLVAAHDSRHACCFFKKRHRYCETAKVPPTTGYFKSRIVSWLFSYVNSILELIEIHRNIENSIDS